MTERVLCPFKYCFFNRPFYVQGTSGEKMSFIWAIGGILLELIWFIGSFSHGLWMIERILCFCLNNIMMIWIRCDPPLLSITVWCSLSVTYWSLFTLDNKITPPSPTQWSNLNTIRDGACLVITLLYTEGEKSVPLEEISELTHNDKDKNCETFLYCLPDKY